MARTPFNAAIGGAATYTVPALKYAVFAAHVIDGNNSVAELKIDGVVIGKANVNASISRSSIKPLVAAAGQVISSPALEKFGLSGFLYDVA